jgi:arginase
MGGRAGNSIALLGVPIDVGASRRGPSRGPDALRRAGLGARLEALGLSVEDHGDVTAREQRPSHGPAPHRVRHYHEIQAWTRALSAWAYGLAKSGAVPIFLGGDHSLSMGSVNGVARHWHEQGRALFVLWLDAHADYNTPATTPSGNMHGMSAAFLCGEGGLEELLGDEPRCPIWPDQLDLFGTRSIDRLERRLLRDRHIAVADMGRIAKLGADVLIRSVLEKVAARNGVLHVSFDVDFLDPSVAPGAGTAVPGGATVSQARRVMELLRESGLVRSVDVVELNPLLDEQGRTARLVVDLISSLFGQRADDDNAGEAGRAYADAAADRG